MRQLATNELLNVSGGNDALLFMGLGLTAVGIGLIGSYPSHYNTYPSVVYEPVYTTTQYVTPVFDPMTGMYMGDMVDTYTDQYYQPTYIYY
jgi:hypothetical protein